MSCRLISALFLKPLKIGVILSQYVYIKNVKKNSVHFPKSIGKQQSFGPYQIVQLIQCSILQFSYICLSFCCVLLFNDAFCLFIIIY